MLTMLRTMVRTVSNRLRRELFEYHQGNCAMKIYLARHGDYLNGNDDFTRGLSERGRRDIAAVANALKEKGVTIHRTIHSRRLRAQQTAEILADTLMSSSVLDMVEGITPNDEPDEFIAETFAKLPTDTIVVGHLPFMGRLVSLLLTGDADKSPDNFEAGTVVCMEQTDNSKWTKLWTVHPSRL